MLSTLAILLNFQQQLNYKAQLAFLLLLIVVSCILVPQQDVASRTALINHIAALIQVHFAIIQYDIKQFPQYCSLYNLSVLLTS